MACKAHAVVAVRRWGSPWGPGFPKMEFWVWVRRVLILAVRTRGYSTPDDNPDEGLLA